MDINYAKFAMKEFEEESYDIHQAEIGMPVRSVADGQPRASPQDRGYFRVTPSYSLLYMDETVHHHYVTFCNAGCTLAWKVLSGGSRVALGHGQIRRAEIRRVGFRRGRPDGRRHPVGRRRDGPDEGSRPQVQNQLRAFLPRVPVLITGPAA